MVFALFCTSRHKGFKNMHSLFGVVLAGLGVGAMLGLMLNYLDTGNPLRICPGHPVRFWVSTTVAAIAAMVLFYGVFPLP